MPPPADRTVHLTKDDIILLACKHFPYLITHQKVRREFRNQLTGPAMPITETVLFSGHRLDRVSFFWSSRPLGEFGHIALRSALSHGHPTYLYTYDDRSQLRQVVPDGVHLVDAREVLPPRLYEECLAKREIHAFSDIFRYALLYEQGGWWLDTDIVLLKPLDFISDHVFSTQWFGLEGGHACVNDVMRAPSGSKHMRHLYEKALAGWNSGHRLEFGALGPSLLTEYLLSAEGTDLIPCVLSPTYFNSIDWTEVDLFTSENGEAFTLLADPRVTGVHLWTKSWRDRGLTPDAALPSSVFRHLTRLFESINLWTDFTTAHTSFELREKRSSSGYERIYFDLLRARSFEKLNILEIGTFCDGQAGSDQDQLASTKTLLDFFPNAIVSSVHRHKIRYEHPRARRYSVDQLTSDALAGFVDDQVAGIDVVLDYGTYPSSERQLALGMLYPALNPHGLYILEELQQSAPVDHRSLGHYIRKLHEEGSFNSHVLSVEANAYISHKTASVRIYDNFERLLADNVHGELGVLRKIGDEDRTFSRVRPAGQSHWRTRDATRRLAFQEVYARGLWGSDKEGRFFSGIGSRGPTADAYLDALCQILRETVAEIGRPITVVDLGCGDFAIGRELLSRMPELSYVGCDIVPELIEHNRDLFGGGRVSFLEVDIVEDPLPPGDVCLLRQVLQHLPNHDVDTILHKLRYRYVYITESQPLEHFGPVNPDKPAGWDVRFDWRVGRGRGLELDQPPFSRELKELWRTNNTTGKETLITYQLLGNVS